MPYYLIIFFPVILSFFGYRRAKHGKNGMWLGGRTLSESPTFLFEASKSRSFRCSILSSTNSNGPIALKLTGERSTAKSLTYVLLTIPSARKFRQLLSEARQRTADFPHIDKPEEIGHVPVRMIVQNLKVYTGVDGHAGFALSKHLIFPLSEDQFDLFLASLDAAIETGAAGETYELTDSDQVSPQDDN